MNIFFTRFFRILWFLFFVLLFFLDRDNTNIKIFLIGYILILTSITVVRILESKKEWGEILKDINEED